MSYLALALDLRWRSSCRRDVKPQLANGAERLLRLRAWFAGRNPEWTVLAGVRCPPDAPMVMPTAGYIGFGWDDSFRPGHRHSGYDIFTPDRAVNVTPVIAAYDGYLTREPDWSSAVIIRHPDFPAVVPDEQIWTYYTHMASADGSQSFIAPRSRRAPASLSCRPARCWATRATGRATPAAPTASTCTSPSSSRRPGRLRQRDRHRQHLRSRPVSRGDAERGRWPDGGAETGQ